MFTVTYGKVSPAFIRKCIAFLNQRKSVINVHQNVDVRKRVIYVHLTHEIANRSNDELYDIDLWVKLIMSEDGKVDLFFADGFIETSEMKFNFTQDTLNDGPDQQKLRNTLISLALRKK